MNDEMTLTIVVNILGHLIIPEQLHYTQFTSYASFIIMGDHYVVNGR